MKLRRFILLAVIFLLALTLPLEKRHIFPAFSRGISGSFSEYLAVSIYISDIVVLLFLFSLFFIGKTRIFKFSSTWIWGIFVWFSVNFILLSRGTIGTYDFIKWIEWLILAIFIGYSSREALYRKAIAIGLTISGLIQTAIALAQFHMQQSLNLRILGEEVLSPNIPGVAKIDLGASKVIRAYGTFAHPNQLSAFLLVACATATYLFLRSMTTKQKLFYGLSILALIAGNFVAFSRAGLFAMVFFFAFIIIYLLVKNIVEKGMLYQLACIFVISLILSGSLFFPYLKARVTPLPTEFNRSYYNTLGLEIIKEHPIAGVGIGNLALAMEQKIQPTQSWQVQPPHNYFLDVACETGIMGLLLIVGLFSTALIKLFKQSNRGDHEQQIFKIILLGVFIAIIFLMFFDHYFYTLQQTQLLLWLVIGMIIGQFETRAYSSVVE